MTPDDDYDFSCGPTTDGLYVFPPGLGKGSQWFARSKGGTHDPNPVIVNGRSKGEALRFARALRRWPALR